MAKITKEQYTKWSKQAKNGFSLDLQYYVIWNEKTLTKRIKMADGDVMEFKIEYQRECKQINGDANVTSKQVNISRC